MGLVIDSSVLIDYERKRLDLDAKIQGREAEEFFLVVITASELLHGVVRASDPQIKAKRGAFVEGILVRFPILEIDINVARVHAQIWADLASKGKMIGMNDSWIAATCIAHGYTLVTSNPRDFEKVPGLKCEVWLPSPQK